MASAFIQQFLTAKPERAIVGLFRVTCAGRHRPVDDRLPFFDPDIDKVVYEMAFPHGRADIALFHADGSATIVEAKEGANGYTHVVQGIGQASFYAAQLNLKGRVRSVRRALLWTSAGCPSLDAVIEDACMQAGVIPLPWASLQVNLAALVAQENGQAQAI